MSLYLNDNTEKLVVEVMLKQKVLTNCWDVISVLAERKSMFGRPENLCSVVDAVVGRPDTPAALRPSFSQLPTLTAVDVS